jgi:hypothetical protein
MADDNNDQLPSIDADMLAAVTGGASGASSTEAVTTMLQTIMSSLKDLAGAQSSPFGGDMMPMMMMMMMMNNRPQQQVVAAAPTVGPDGVPIGPGGWQRVA